MPVNKKPLTEFHVVHGQACAILLPEVIRYNGIQSKKLSVWPKVERYCADEKYAKICRIPGLMVPFKRAAKDELADAVLNLGKDIGIDRNFSSVIPDEKL